MSLVMRFWFGCPRSFDSGRIHAFAVIFCVYVRVWADCALWLGGGAVLCRMSVRSVGRPGQPASAGSPGQAFVFESCWGGLASAQRSVCAVGFWSGLAALSLTISMRCCCLLPSQYRCFCQLVRMTMWGDRASRECGEWHACVRQPLASKGGCAALPPLAGRPGGMSDTGAPRAASFCIRACAPLWGQPLGSKFVYFSMSP